MTGIDLQNLQPEVIAAMLPALRSKADNRQTVASRLVDFFYENLIDSRTGGPACVLVRCFQTCPYAGLPLSYRDAADRFHADLGESPDMRCLGLLATRGQRSIWNHPSTSIGHQAIPLPSAEVVRRAPMIARLLDQLRIPVEHMASPAGASIALHGLPDNFNLFHIAAAQGSPYIPAQDDFVRPYGVQSVLGMGGLLPDGELLAVILFTCVPVTRATATLFGTLAPVLKDLLSPFSTNHAFSRYG